MNSGQMTSISTASTSRLLLPFWVYMGKTTRCWRPSSRCSCGWKARSEARKSGTPKPAVAQARKSARDCLEVGGVVREPGSQFLNGLNDRGNMARGGRMRVRVGDGSVLDLEQLE